MGAIISIASWLMGTICFKKCPQTPFQKYAVCDGVVLFDYGSSPNARKIRILLQEKQIKYYKVEVDLLVGEQKSSQYLMINPNGKIPSLRIHNVKRVPDCCLFETAAICEFLNHFWPDDLYPQDLWGKTSVKIWQDWETSMSENFFPVLQSNFLPFLLRFKYKSRERFKVSIPTNLPKHLRMQYMGLYDGTGVLCHEELKLYVMSCYRMLNQLERELEDKHYLLGNKLSIADIFIYPRISAFGKVGMPIEKDFFPNTCQYLKRLSKRSSVKGSEGLKEWIGNILFSYLSPLVVAIGNIKSGKTHTRYLGDKLIPRVICEMQECPLPQRLLVADSGTNVVVPDYPTAECWQIKLLLLEKNHVFQTVPGDFLDLIGRPMGSEGIYRIQHGQRITSGSKAALFYLDEALPGTRMIPSDPHQRALCTMWQSWEQVMYVTEMYPLVESHILSKMLLERYTDDDAGELLKLRSAPFYHTKFHDILRLYLHEAVLGTAGWDAARGVCGIYPSCKHGPEQDQVVESHTKLHGRLTYLEDALQNGAYLVGNDLTLADICVFCRLLYMPYIGIKLSDKKYPALCRWFLGLKSRRAFRQISDEVDKCMQICR